MPGRARMALRAAAVGIGLLILTWYAAFHIGYVEHADRSILEGFAGLGTRPRINSTANFIAGLCDPNPYVYLCAVPFAIALARRRYWLATAICAILLGANVTTQLLKPILAHPRAAPGLLILAPSSASWPSGHATAAMALALCCVLAVPARLRPWAAALGGAFAVAVCYSFLSLDWHYPSDVLGGFLVAAVWVLLGIAAVLIADQRGRAPREESVTGKLSLREALGPPAVALLGALLLALLVVVARPDAVVAYARLHKTFVIGAAGIGAAGLAVATGVLLALRR
jgi:membrane-associated phospholipid phosphatase